MYYYNICKIYKQSKNTLKNILNNILYITNRDTHKILKKSIIFIDYDY